MMIIFTVPKECSSRARPFHVKRAVCAYPRRDWPVTAPKGGDPSQGMMGREGFSPVVIISQLLQYARPLAPVLAGSLFFSIRKSGGRCYSFLQARVLSTLSLDTGSCCSLSSFQKRHQSLFQLWPKILGSGSLVRYCCRQE